MLWISHKESFQSIINMRETQQFSRLSNLPSNVFTEKYYIQISILYVLQLQTNSLWGSTIKAKQFNNF